jgi:flagellar biosynthesis chaperone FliJ
LGETAEQVKQALREEEEKRNTIEKKVADLRAGLSEKAETDRQQVISKLEELQALCVGSSAEAIGRAIEAVARIVDTPVLTREASEIMLRSLEEWLEQASGDLTTFMQSIKTTLDTFISKYSDELDAQIKTRKKEEEVLQQLSVYLSRYV